MRTEYRIVLAEDEVVLLSVFQRMIKRLEPTAIVQMYRNGLEALHSYEQQGADLLIVNCEMPEMDGPMLIRTLRERGDMVPIIATGDPWNQEELLCAGATVFVETTILFAHFPALLARFKPE